MHLLAEGEVIIQFNQLFAHVLHTVFKIEGGFGRVGHVLAENFEEQLAQLTVRVLASSKRITGLVTISLRL